MPLYKIINTCITLFQKNSFNLQPNYKNHKSVIMKKLFSLIFILSLTIYTTNISVFAQDSTDMAGDSSAMEMTDSAAADSAQEAEPVELHH